VREYCFSARVESPRDTVFDLLMDPSNLPRFVSQVEVVEPAGDDRVLLRGPGCLRSAPPSPLSMFCGEWSGVLAPTGVAGSRWTATMTPEWRSCVPNSDAQLRLTHCSA
jgi:hypothetical protein